MKKALLFSIFIICIQNAIAQKKDSTLKLSDIQLSNAPAFSLLDVSPSSIETTPTTKAFGISIANAINQGNGIPQNYAFEVTPFWFMKHPNMTSFKYTGIDSNGRNKAFSQAKFWAVSFALINNDSTTNIGRLANHDVALGLRATIIKIYSKGTTQKIKKIDSAWHGAQVASLNMLHGQRPNAHLFDSINRVVDSMDHITDSTMEFHSTMNACMQERPLFSIDLAAATSAGFLNNSFNNSKMLRTGLWMNIAFSKGLNKNNNTTASTNTNYLNIYGIVRYINSNDSLKVDGTTLNTNYFDLGLKFELQVSKLSVSYEYIIRTSSNKAIASTYKSAGVLHYKIKDGLFLTGAFGQNFSTINNLIATVGINWGISNGTEKIQ